MNYKPLQIETIKRLKQNGFSWKFQCTFKAYIILIRRFNPEYVSIFDFKAVFSDFVLHDDELDDETSSFSSFILKLTYKIIEFFLQRWIEKAKHSLQSLLIITYTQAHTNTYTSFGNIHCG